MSKSEASLLVEDILAQHAASACQGWWQSGGDQLLTLLAQAENECRNTPTKTQLRVWGREEPVKDGFESERSCGYGSEPSVALESELIRLDNYLVQISFGLLFESLRGPFRHSYVRFCLAKFGWNISEDTIDDSLNEVRIRLLLGPIENLRLLTHPYPHPHSRDALYYQVSRGISGLKSFWHLDRKAKFVSLESDLGIEGPQFTELFRREIWEILDASVELNEREKRVLRLKYDGDCTIREVAVAMNLGIATVSVTLHHATVRFRDVLRRAHNNDSEPDQ